MVVSQKVCNIYLYLSQRMAGSEAETWPKRSCLLLFFPVKLNLLVIQLGDFTPVSLAVAGSVAVISNVALVNLPLRFHQDFKA